MCFQICVFLFKCNFFVNDLKKNISCLFCGEYFVLSGTDINIMDFDYMENYQLGDPDTQHWRCFVTLWK